MLTEDVASFVDVVVVAAVVVVVGVVSLPLLFLRHKSSGSVSN